MRRALTIVLVLALAPLAPAQDDPTENPAVAILKAVVESKGGEEALGKITGFKAEYKGVYKAGAMESPFTSEVSISLPDNLVWKLDSAGYGGSMGMENGTTWTAFMVPPARCRDAMDGMIHEWLLHYQTTLVQPLLTRDDVEFALLATEKKENAVVHRIRLVFGGEDTFELRVTAAAGKSYVTSYSGEMTHVDGRTGAFVTTLSDPKVFGGITVMSKITTTHRVGEDPDMIISEEIVSYEWNPELTEDYFAVPDRGEFEKPEARQAEGFTALVLLHSGGYENMDETIDKARALAAKMGLMTTDTVVATFLTDPGQTPDPADYRTEIAVPFMLMGPPPTEIPDGAEIKEVPSMMVASMRVRGEYGTVEQRTFPALAGWMMQNGHGFGGPPRMFFMHRPEQIVPEDQVSELQFPVK